MSKSRRDRPPIAPKREEIARFEQTLDGLSGLALSEETFLRNSEMILKRVEEFEKDANVNLRWVNHLKYIDDYSPEQMEKDIAQIELTRSKLEGSHVSDEDIESMNHEELKKYATVVKLPNRSKHKTKTALYDALILHLSGVGEAA